MNKSEHHAFFIWSPLISITKSLMGPDLTMDLNLLEGDPPASIKYIGNENQLNLIRATVIFQLIFTLYCFYNSCRSVFNERWNCRLPWFDRLQMEERFLYPCLTLRRLKTTYFNNHHNCVMVTNSYSFDSHTWDLINLKVEMSQQTISKR